MLKIMIAEDDLMIADSLEEMLTLNGYEVCGIARTVREGVALGLLHRPDLAVLDLRLAEGGLGTEIALALKSAFRVGVLYATGNTAKIDAPGSHGEAYITKPYRDESILRALQIVADVAEGKAASSPFPRGFHLLPPEAPVAKAPHA